MTLEEQIEQARAAHKRVWDAQREVSHAVEERARLAWKIHQDHGLSWRKIGKLINMPEGSWSQLWREVRRHVV